MKRNMIRAMDNLEVDENIRGLIGKMWKHGYDTLHSCGGHFPLWEPVELYDEKTGDIEESYEIIDFFTKYVAYRKGTGDGWLEKNLSEFGFDKSCEMTLGDFQRDIFVDAVVHQAIDPYVTELPNGEFELNWNAIYGDQK